MASSKTRGFSLIEMVMVVAIALIMMGITFVSLAPVLKNAHSDQAYSIVLSQLRLARTRAVADRQQYIVCFGSSATPTGASTSTYGAPSAQSVQVYELPYGSALSSAVQINKIDLPSDVLFQTSGLPTTSPDGFGTGTVPLDFDQGISSNAIKNQVMFSPDGTARDTNGNLNSGIVYMEQNSNTYSARAITVWGGSGRIRGWRLTNGSATYPWVQQ